ncbi:hypothetical protein D0B54_03585 [Solimonas sp. K1W22B-7]|nr:hypothetical protein D0B54_03585 [Solimonas sp. K1W22B-7]
MRIPSWRRLLLGVAPLPPMLLMLAGLLSQASQLSWNHAFAVASCIALILACGWLLARFHSLGSIELDNEGLSQSFLGLRGIRRQRLAWEQVRRVSYQRGWYRFHGEGGVKLELGTMLLPDARVTVRALRLLMPQRLLAQLGLHPR